MGLFCISCSIISTLKVLLFIGVATFIGGLIVLPILIIYVRIHFAKNRAGRLRKETVVGFFHPYCNAGGGGERVLWAAIKSIQTKYPSVHIAVYTGDLDAEAEQIIKKAEKGFNIQLKPGIEFIYLHKRKWVEAAPYPYFTLLGQSLGSVWLGLEALNSLQPDIYIDTMGYAFTYPLFKYIGGCQVGCYTHYPTISTDMLRHVYRRVVSHNNRRIIARNPFLSAAKIAYYKLFAAIYGLVGRCAETVMVNSTWTEEHINAIWNCPFKTHRVYPPCDVEHLTKLPLLTMEDKNGIIKIVSVGQFRPEKDHPLQLRALYELRSIVSEELWERIRLVFIGSCRNTDDEARVKDMQDLAKHLALDENVEFKLNVPYPELVRELQEGTIGIHAMWNEHFGIGIVECMAAGLIMVAHASGGPKADIIETQRGSQTGFLAENEKEYAKVMAYIMSMHAKDRDQIRTAARASVNRFSGENFEKGFLRAVEPFFRSKQE
ncbi:GDP-Man:Man(3)GlcNAc(2)-PP-Dol alpha-1,2-mannosyltransferase [Neodiprion pinetum]|uniref:GDP-Man:Man(3)GlcNAc(2)-PP-Dol alpha-1,2-mannosyltransferase n=1 Tax=Neodiprion pinetum TaxID=441929 RepID=UPI001EDE0F3A|nr:GDP-Man:Man(3)GlcNAc(2)-PP-Dol alpha-1,2-mannosyltransferase [Neodiprion pinetum]